MRLTQVSIRGLLVLVATVGFVISYAINFSRMRIAESELAKLRDEVGFLQPSESDEVAAVRVLADEPLTWQSRVRIPAGQMYRLAYSALWTASKQAPEWFAAHPMRPGESTIIVRVLKDPRDDRWKMSTIIRHADGVSRIATALPDEMSSVFRGSHDVISAGVGRQTVTRPGGDPLRIIDERFFAGNSMLLYGDRGPSEDMVGVFVELQVDRGPLAAASATSSRDDSDND
jgi:hypothetical protein